MSSVTVSLMLPASSLMFTPLSLLSSRMDGNTVPADRIVNPVTCGALDETPHNAPGNWSHDPSDRVEVRRRLAAWIMGDGS